MSIRSEIVTDIEAIFGSGWSERKGYVVPDDSSVTLANDGVQLDATVMYADLADSTKLVDQYSPQFAAEVYKAFLRCSARVVRANAGTITAYDGDRLMAIFLGDQQVVSATKAALQIKNGVNTIVRPALSRHYPTKNYVLRHVVGVDTSSLFVAKTGVRGANDLVWVGRAANYAAKLTSCDHVFSTYITAECYAALGNTFRASSDGGSTWQAARWNSFDNRIVYRTNHSIEIK